MTRCRVIVAGEALALLGILVWALARPVTAARGRDEIDYRHLLPLPLAAQQTVTQDLPLRQERLIDVPADQEQLSGIAIPYQLPGGLPARIRVLVTDQTGLALVQVVQQFEPSKTLEFATVRVEGRQATGSSAGGRSGRPADPGRLPHRQHRPAVDAGATRYHACSANAVWRLAAGCRQGAAVCRPGRLARPAMVPTPG